MPTVPRKKLTAASLLQHISHTLLSTVRSSYGGARIVFGLDDQAPAGPDQTRGGQRHILVHRKILDGAVEVADARDHYAPLLRVLHPGAGGEGADRQTTNLENGCLCGRETG